MKNGSSEAPDEYKELANSLADDLFGKYVDMPLAERYKGAFRDDGLIMISNIVLKNAVCWYSNGPVDHAFLRVQLQHITAWTWGKIGHAD